MVDILVPDKKVKSEDPPYQDRQDSQNAVNMVDYIARTHREWRTYYDLEFVRSFDNFRFFLGTDYGQWDPNSVDRMKREERFIMTFNLAAQKVEGIWSMLLKVDYDTDFLPIEAGRVNLLSIAKELKNRDKELLNYDQTSALLRLHGLIAQGVEGIYIERDFPADELGYIGRRTYLPWHVLFTPYWLTQSIRDNDETIIDAWLTADEIKRQYHVDADEVDHAIRERYEKGNKPLYPQGAAPYKDDVGHYGEKHRVMERHFLEQKDVDIYYDPGSGQTLPLQGDDNYKKSWAQINGFDFNYAIHKKSYTWIHRVQSACQELLPQTLCADGISEIQLGHLLPYCPWSAMRLNGKWRSIIDLALDANKLVNKSVSLNADVARSSANNTMLYKKELFDNAEDERTFVQNINKPGQKIPVSGSIQGRIEEHIYNVNQAQTNNGLAHELVTMMDMLDRVAKVPAASDSRQESASESGVLYRAKYQAAQMQTYSLQESLRQHENDMTEMWFLQAQRQYAQLPRELINKSGKSMMINDSDDTDISKMPRAKVIITESKDSDLTRSYEREMYMDYLKTIPAIMPTVQVLASAEAAKRFEMKEQDREQAMQAIDLDMQVAMKGQQLKLAQINQQLEAIQNPKPQQDKPKPPSVAIHYADLPPEGQVQAAQLAGIQLNPQQATTKQLFDKEQLSGQNLSPEATQQQPQGPLPPPPMPGPDNQQLSMQPQNKNINTNSAQKSPLTTPVL